MANVANKLKCLIQIKEYFSKSKRPPIQLATASGHEMEIIASGAINDMFDKVYIIPQIEETLLSLELLQAKGYVIIGPSEGGLIVLEPTKEDPKYGKVMIITDSKYGFDLQDKPDFPDLVLLPDVSNIISKQKQMNRISARALLKAAAIKAHGVAALTVQERVNLLQRTHLCSYTQLHWMTGHHDFICDQAEIEKYFSWEPCYRMAHMQSHRHQIEIDMITLKL